MGAARNSKFDLTRGMALVYATVIIAHFEKYKEAAYNATEDERKRGIYTIGFGKTRGVKAGDRTNLVGATDDLVNTVSSILDGLEYDFRNSDKSIYELYNYKQIAAIASLVYNIGGDAWHKSNVYNKYLVGDVNGLIKGAYDPVNGFVRQGGNILNGLVDRRTIEASFIINKPTTTQTNKGA